MARPREKHPLFDAERWTATWERALQAIFEIRSRRGAPMHYVAEDYAPED